jgi:hypothetical protein
MVVVVVVVVVVVAVVVVVVVGIGSVVCCAHVRRSLYAAKTARSAEKKAIKSRARFCF